MSTTKEVLQQMNPGLFDFNQPSSPHNIFVTGIRKSDPDDNTKKINVFVQKSNPTDAAKNAGVKASEFIHTSFKPTGAIKEVDSVLTFGGPKKAQVGVTFQSAQPDLFNFIKAAIDAKDYEVEGETTITDSKTGKTYKRPVIRINRNVFGKIIIANVPVYRPHNMGADGKFHALSPVTLDTATGKYVKKDTQLGVIKFFADDEDLQSLAEVTARMVDKRVRPFVVDKKSLVVENAFGDKRVEVTEAAIVQADEETGEVVEIEDNEGEVMN